MATWSGLRPCSADGLPIIGLSSRVENIMLATGHGMTGIAMAPVTGVLIAQILLGEPPGHDLDAFSPDRFLGRGVRGRGSTEESQNQSPSSAKQAGHTAP
jgi:glycine/D-amino acid oxidase-like deaminating enzyme